MFHTRIPSSISVFYVFNDIFISHFGTWCCFQTQGRFAQKSLSPVKEPDQEGKKCKSDQLTIPNDGTDVWEIDPKHLTYGNQIASGSYGEL